MDCHDKVLKVFEERFMIAVENKFRKYVRCCIEGIKKDYYRKKATRENRETYYGSTPPPLVSYTYRDNFTDSFSGNDDLMLIDNDKLSDAINSLTPRQKEIVIRVIAEKRTECEVAATLAISQQAVNASKVRAIRRIKSKFGRV